ncbi:MAG: hypothetical protein JSU94_14435 [Phycisphaerales bacterium]|nr:MAG: hypothetical protein JSU94_14435 [Phycisphaerales bacterium]
MKKKSFTAILYATLCVAMLYLSLPETLARSDLQAIRGGECKPTCKKNYDCDGKKACPGNCTGADNGTLCGKELETTPSGDVWGCGDPVKDGGGCNKGTTASASAQQCKCNAYNCGHNYGTTTCDYWTTCKTD